MGKYEGWNNWETWNVALWLSNDQGLYEATMETVAETSPSVSQTANAIEGLFESYFLEPLEDIPACQTGPIADMINASVREVDWREIAEHWIQDYTESLE